MIRKFACNQDFIDEVLKKYEYFKKSSDDFCGISIIAHYEVMIELLNSFVKNTDFRLVNIEIGEPSLEGYCKEWVLNIDPDGGIWCEKVYREGYGGYLYCEEDVVFVHEDVDGNFIKKNANENIVLFSIDDEENEDDECDDLNCEGCSNSIYVTKDDAGTPIGFTKSKVFSHDGYTEQYSFSHYSDDIDFLRKVADVFGVKI